MFVPLHDDNPLKKIQAQFVTIALIVANVVIFAGVQSGIFANGEETALSFGVIPAVLFDFEELAPEFAVIPEGLTLLTYNFVHGSWLHLIGNMLFLWVFGDNVEDATGHFRFLLFYLGCGIFAGLAHSATLPASDLPLVGASGAVAGVIGAYLMLHPKVRLWVLIMWRIPIRVPALWALGFWAAMQLFNALGSAGDNVAWWAHVGGLAAGAGLIVFLRRPGVPLFDRPLAADRTE
ncbi:MAG TPA: rhomboid family intramembrane serine protease [Hyphomicrobiales bacterium]|nr:rhomboid family intramembrane serine protease [Rhodobiaceae bacterium]HXK53289.1 rhomboid family intramembrane serine protease [Hyphomicrobiales bacterium]